jgi:16S rRNA (uracil1498-N3)-methyltransferase
MSRRRFFVPKDGIGESSAELPPEQAHHLHRVLRIGNGAEVELFDGEGGVYLGAVDISGSRVRVRDLVTIPEAEDRGPRVILGSALIKPARFEWLLEKTTELGVREIVPLETRFSDGRIADAAGQARIGRWRRILQQACEQCGRTRIPVLQLPMHVSDWLQLNDLRGARRIFCCARGARWGELKVQTPVVALSIGPEGGWDESEITGAENAGWDMLSLGESTLRAETAAIAAVTLARLTGE